MLTSINRNVAIAFDDLTEFFAVRRDIEALKKEKVDVDIYVIYNYSEQMRDYTVKGIERCGYEVKTIPSKDKRYKILLEPYPILGTDKLDYEFRIRYSYGAASAKPDPVFLPDGNILYDAIMAYSKRDVEAKGVYSKAFHVKYSKYDKFKKISHTGKPNLLYLPTFGEDSSVSSIDKKTIADLKRSYNIIVKAHHAMQFRDTEKDRESLIKNIADEFCDSSVPLETLLAKADVVLSDNSGAIFESIYSNTPVALFSDNINARKIGELDTFQYELFKREVIPWVSKPEDIPNALSRALALSKKQESIIKENFTPDSKSNMNTILSVVIEYLNKDKKKDVYSIMHDILLSRFYDNRQQNNVSTEQIENIEQTVRQEYENSKSWRVTKPMREISKVLRR